MFGGTVEGFRPKGVQGIMANYCCGCGSHLDLHGSRWIPGTGSIRTCPPTVPKPTSDNTSLSVTPSPAKVPAAPLATPFGTETCYEQVSPRRAKKVVAGAPVDSMSGSTVVRDEPTVIVPLSPFAPKSSLSGSGVQSCYDERQDWVPTKAVVRLQESNLAGQSLVPTRSESPKRRGPRTVIKS
jgi:hypothetical protein